MLQERVRAWFAVAKKSGTKSGKAVGRPAVSEAVEDRKRALRAKGMGMGMLKIAAQAGCGVSVVQRVLAAA